MLPDAGVLATILLIVGLFLLAVELMIPSFGIIGIMSAITLLISAWCAWQAWWTTSPGFFWTYAAFWLLGIPAVLGGGLFILQNTSLGDRLVLRGPSTDAVGTPTIRENSLESLVGIIGTANSLLTPGGMVTINGERFHAESPGMMIEAGTPVQVINVKGSRLVVRAHIHLNEKPLATDDPSSGRTDATADTVIAADLAESATAASAPESGQADVLDFDIPVD